MSNAAHLAYKLVLLQLPLLHPEQELCVLGAQPGQADRKLVLSVPCGVLRSGAQAHVAIRQ